MSIRNNLKQFYSLHLYLYSIYIHTCAYIYIYTHAHTNNALILHDFSNSQAKIQTLLKSEHIQMFHLLYDSTLNNIAIYINKQKFSR